MSNELESDRAMVMNLESFGVDGVETETDAKFDKPAVRIMLQVTQIARFLLEPRRGLRFRNLQVGNLLRT